GGDREFAADKARARQRFQRLEVFVDRQSNCLGLDGEEDVADACANRRFGSFANAETHRGRRLVRKEQALVVLWISDAVVDKIPVKAIGARVTRVAAGATLPALKANAGVVEVKLSLAHD